MENRTHTDLKQFGFEWLMWVTLGIVLNFFTHVFVVSDNKLYYKVGRVWIRLCSLISWELESMVRNW